MNFTAFSKVARRDLSVKIGICDDSIAAITAMKTVHRARQNLHHCQKPTSSRYYQLTPTSRLLDRFD